MLLALGTAALAGCLFKPRSPEPPCTPGTSGCQTPVPFQDPLTAEIARDNIINALRKRGTDGPTLDPNYNLSMHVDFQYEPDAAALAASSTRSCQPFFDPWDREREFEFMELVLFTGGGGLAVPDSAELTVPVFQQESGLPDQNLARYNVEYVLTLKFGATNTTPRRVECYAARALWDFSGVVNNDFRLIRWEDVEGRDTACPGGIAQGSIGNLRALDGQCP